MKILRKKRKNMKNFFKYRSIKLILKKKRRRRIKKYKRRKQGFKI
jgi:hypothetical protein